MSSLIPKSRNHFQLFNSNHKNDLVKLFRGLKRFKPNENAEEDDDSSSRLLDEDFLSEEEDVPELQLDPVNELSISSVKEGIVSCTTCDIAFTDVSEHRFHYKLDWHRYNLKRKICGQPPVSEADFGEMMDDLSSIEGSDCEDGESPDLPISRLLEKVELEKDYEEKSKKSKSELKLGNSPKIFFENGDADVFSIYKTIVSKGNDNKSTEKAEDVYPLSSFLTNPPLWALVMVSGGHFAGAVFEGSSVLAHKTFHSYTVRAKQGGSQGAQDSKSGTSHPKSAGASLRRYNEASFTQHIQELLESWKEKLNRCSLIFYRAASSSSNSLFGGKNPPLQRNNPRIRNIPFPSMRPTFKEIKRVHSILSGVHVYGGRDEFIAKHLTPKNKQEDSTKSKRSKRKKANIDRAKSRSPVKRDEPERPLSSPDVGSDVEFTIEECDQEINFNHLEEYGSSLTKEEIEGRRQSRIKKAKPKKNKTEEFPRPSGIIGDIMSGILSNESSQLDDQLRILAQESETRRNDKSFSNELNQLINVQSFTILHLAVTKDLQNVIWVLLECGCDPAIKDKNGKYPYNHAETKECRMIFRKFRGQYPEKYDYDKAQVPAPLSEEQEQEKLEKKRALNKLKREKEKIKKLEKKEKEKEADEKDRFLNLSDREKRALAAERRILGTCKQKKEKAPILVRCFECATDITGKVPFEYNLNVFCSSKCLVVHRKKFPTDLTA